MSRKEQITESAQAVDAREISPVAWRVMSLMVLAGAAFIRLYQLGLKPMHHDEGVNGFFLMNLARKGVYQYNPENYHGPTLYYFALAVTKLNGLLFGGDGLGTVAVRLVPVAFGVGTVWLALCLRRNIGAVGALAAAALIAVSPGSVYVSRYFIHEAQFVFFTFGIVVAALLYLDSADPSYLLLASLSAALLFATKETSIITAAVLLLALAVAHVYRRLFAGTPAPWEKKSPPKRKGKKRAPARVEPLTRFGGWSNVLLWSAAALSLFVFVNVLFYSSFFTYSKGVGDAVQSFQVWAKTGTASKDHAHDWFTYFVWLWYEEAPLLILGLAGAVVALVRRTNRFALFAGAWAFGTLAAYSLIRYKTPWLMLNFTVPLAVAGGYAVGQLYNFDADLKLRAAAVAICAAALAVSCTQSVILNFRQYDNDAYPYVYAHTNRGFLSMVGEIERLAERSGQGKQTGVTITSPDYWPLPWYLRDYEHAWFHGKMTSTNEPIVVGKDDQVGELTSLLGGQYEVVDYYPLRPGVTLVLFARKDLVEK